MSSNLQVSISASVKGLTDGMREAASAVRDNTAKMEQTLGSLTGAFEKVKGPLLAMGAAIGSGALFKNAVKDTMAYTEALWKLSTIAGVTTERAAGISNALGSLGLGTEVYANSIMRLQRALETQEATFNRNGVATRNLKGEHLAIQDVFLNVLDRVREMKVGYDANSLALLAFGRGAAELTPLMRLTEEEMNKGEKSAKALGIALGSDAVEGMWAYKGVLDTIGNTLTAFKVVITNELLPSFVAFGDWLGGAGPGMVGVLTSAFKVLREVLGSTTIQIAGLVLLLKGPATTAWVTLTNNVYKFVDTLRVQYSLAVAESVRQTTAQAKALGLTTEAARQLGMVSGPMLADKLKAGFGALASFINWQVLLVGALIAAAFAFERWRGASERAQKEALKSAQSARHQAAEFRNLADQALNLEKRMSVGAATDAAAARDKERLRYTVEQLNATYPGFNKLLRDEDGNQRSIAEALEIVIDLRRQELEIALGAAKAEVAKTEAAKQSVEAEKVAAQAKVAELRAELQKVSPSDYRAIGVIGLQAGAAEQAVGRLDDKIKSLGDQGSKQNAIVAEIAGTLSTLSGSDTTEAQGGGEYVSRLESDKETKDADKHGRELATIRARWEREVVDERAKLWIQANEDLEKTTEDDAEIRAFIEKRLFEKLEELDQKAKQKRLDRAFDQFNKEAELSEKAWRAEIAAQREAYEAMERQARQYLNIVGSAVVSAFDAIMEGQFNAVEALKSMMKELARAVIRALVDILVETVAGSIAKKAIEKSAGITSVTISAAEGGAKAAAQVAGIPFVGPAAAVAAGAAMFAAIEGAFIPPIAVAAKGYDIPYGVNPLIQAHSREVVLPAELADKFRNAAEPQGQTTIVNNYWTVRAFDAKGVQEMLESHEYAVGEREARRNRRR